MISNNARVARALYLLKLDLDNFVAREFTNHHQDQTITVLNQILGQSRDAQKPFNNMKTQDLLSVVQASWWNVFDRAMGGIEPGLVREVALTHESWSGRNNFTSEGAFQALTCVQRLLAAMSSPSTLELDMLKRECLEWDLETAELEAGYSTVSDDQLTKREETTAGQDSIVDVEAATAGNGEDLPAAAGEEEAASDDGDFYAAGFVRALKEIGALRYEDLMSIAVRAGSEAQYADDSLAQELGPPLVQALGKQGIDQLFGYQGEVLSHLLAGRNVALEAGRGADETVTMAVPLAEILLRNPGSHGLLLCPDEESARILAVGMNPLLWEAGIRITADPGEIPGSVPVPGEQAPSTVLVTSVDALNGALASLREEWQPLLKDLKFIGVCLAEEYRGHFGANVAVLLRRLAHRLAVLGASFQYLAIARGCANCAELAGNLTGQEFQAVFDFGKPSAGRHILAVSPNDPEEPGQVDLPDRIARAVLACVGTDRSVMVYCSGDNLAQTAFAATREMAERQGFDEGAFSLAMEKSTVLTGHVDGEPGDPQGPCAVFASLPPAAHGPSGHFDGVIVAGNFTRVDAALRLLEFGGSAGEGEAFALYYTPNDIEGRFVARNIEALLGQGPDQVVVDPDMPAIISPHLPALVNESEGRVYSFSREALGNAVFQTLRREAAAPAKGEEPQTVAVELRPPGQQEWGLWLDGQQHSSLAPYGKFREIYQGSVVALDGRKYRVALVDPGEEGDRSPAIVLEAAEALANLRTSPSISQSVEVLEESLCLSLAPGVSLHLGGVAVEEELVKVSVIDDSRIDDSSSPEQAAEVQQAEDRQELVTATFVPDENARWSMRGQAFWLDVPGPVEEDAASTGKGGQTVDARAIGALEQMFRVGARLTFPVGKYDLATYSQGSSIFLVEVSPESLGIVKKALDSWKDILQSGARVARNCRCISGCAFCLLPASPHDYPLDKAGGLALADRLLEITPGS